MPIIGTVASGYNVSITPTVESLVVAGGGGGGYYHGGGGGSGEGASGGGTVVKYVEGIFLETGVVGDYAAMLFCGRFAGGTA